MTQAETIKAVRALGLVCVWDRVWAEWRVDYKPGDARRSPLSAYHTTDREDAVGTAQMMARCPAGMPNVSIQV